MRITELIYTAVVSILTTLSFQSAALAQKTAEPSQLKVSVAIESDKLSPQKPARITITIKNLLDQELDIKLTCAFELLSTRTEAVARKHQVFGDSYWSPVNVSTGTPKNLNVIEPELLKKGVVVGRVPDETLHFGRKEAKTFTLDPTKTLWNASIGNDWPRWNLFEVVPKGTYSLNFRIDSAGSLKSNAVTVTIE